MFVRYIGFLLGAAIFVAFAGGCKKSQPEQKSGSQSQEQAQSFTNSAPGDVIARIHWLGKKRIAADPNAAGFMGIWNMPETQKLETQTLDKLALAPWDLPRSGTNLAAIIATNASSALLRPLLSDLLQEECYLEIRQPTNQPGQAVLAIHLDDQRAATWKNNVSALTNSPITNYQSQITNLTVSRARQWTLLGFGQSQNALVQDFAGRIQRNGAPFAPNPTNYWIDAQVDLKRVSDALSLNWPLPQNTPTNITITFIGDGGNVLTRGEFEFPQPLPIELEPWNVPTNLIHDPLIGFSALRGFRPLLKSFKPWNDLQLGTPPNQAYTWAQHGTPWMHFAAVPSAESSNQVDRLADFVVRDIDPKLTVSRLGAFEKLPGTQHLKWKGVPVFSPDLNWTNIDGNSYILAGFYSRPLTEQPSPAELFPQFSGSTNMIWYDWEFSKESLEGWTPISQVVRHAFRLPRFTADPDIVWLLAVATQLGNCVSALKLESPTHLSFTRQSTMGFTAPEIPLLLDWLESPKFPSGLHTLLADPNENPEFTARPNTNSAAEQKKP